MCKISMQTIEKSYNQSIFSLRIITLFYIMWHGIIQHNIILYRDSSSQDRVDFLVPHTDAASYFVWKILVEKITLSAT